jgi:hypothetical protein
MGIAELGRRTEEGPGRKVLEGPRMVLERAGEIGLGRVAGIAGLGEEREVGESEPLDQEPGLGEPTLGTAGGVAGVDQRGQHEQEQDEADDEHAVGAAKPTGPHATWPAWHVR